MNAIVNDATGTALGGTQKNRKFVSSFPGCEPILAGYFREALAASPEARAVWDATTPLARLDWIHWIVSAKQAKTRAKRIGDACDMLSSGKKRVCCFDPSGYYSKALRAPEAAE